MIGKVIFTNIYKLVFCLLENSFGIVKINFVEEFMVLIFFFLGLLVNPDCFRQIKNCVSYGWIGCLFKVDLIVGVFSLVIIESLVNSDVQIMGFLWLLFYERLVVWGCQNPGHVNKR